LFGTQTAFSVSFFLRMEVSLRVCMLCSLRKGARNHDTWITADEA